ncbi:hypothetical protein H7347_09030 [Corynebacterium sp. zg-331]|uniref:hypothetical protein n=1 Tax=unclassified Corynebacterium TaxID=2624378 RepID=UPI00128C2DC5|nr:MULTISPECIES: hypothetical protein [unclassified Corynebacterium]MBC3186704.1 hypothetical protein [Corynebacterium sp. zg-331]MPV53186.1 hypothetical protein [Corynebacterium sp. zg331]
MVKGFKVPRWLYFLVSIILFCFIFLLLILDVGTLVNKGKLAVSAVMVVVAVLTIWQKILSDERSEWWRRFEWAVKQENEPTPDWLLLAQVYDGLLRERKWPRVDADFYGCLADHGLRC